VAVFERRRVRSEDGRTLRGIVTAGRIAIESVNTLAVLSAPGTVAVESSQTTGRVVVTSRIEVKRYGPPATFK